MANPNLKLTKKVRGKPREFESRKLDFGEIVFVTHENTVELNICKDSIVYQFALPNVAMIRNLLSGWLDAKRTRDSRRAAKDRAAPNNNGL